MSPLVRAVFWLLLVAVFFGGVISTVLIYTNHMAEGLELATLGGKAVFGVVFLVLIGLGIKYGIDNA